MPSGVQPSLNPSAATPATNSLAPVASEKVSGGRRHAFPAAYWLSGIVMLLAIWGATMWLLASDSNSTYGFRVVKTYPHDRAAYCQGLVIDGDTLIEGTGQFKQSSLRRVELATGKVLQQMKLDDRVFGEGVTVMGDKVYQITWQNRICYVYDRTTLRPLKQFTYEGEGWGITHDGEHLIMSDGSSTLRFFKPETFEEVKRLAVKSAGRAVAQLNELEFVEGEIFANVWHADYIVRIDLKSGEVTGVIDLAQLYPRRERNNREAVLNGIAYDAAGKRLFVTGKNWPKLYEIEIVPLRK